MFTRYFYFFTSQVHEKTCSDGKASLKTEEPKDKFFNYLKMNPTSRASTLSSNSSSVVRPRPSTYAKFLSIDVSSPLGQYIYSLSSTYNRDEVIDISSLCMAERKSALRSYVEHNRSDEIIFSRSEYFPHMYQGGHGEEFPVTSRSKQKAPKEDPRIYCFNQRQMAVRKFTLDNGKNF